MTMTDLGYEVRPASLIDAEQVAALAGALALSFPFERAAFDRSFPALLADEHACLLVAAGADGACLGYVLAFEHLTFYANGPVAWVEEILVRPEHRRLRVGDALMAAAGEWATGRDCALVALATRRAAPFYLALGFEESAVYFRRVLRDGG
jgi:GNAT superfamily N-acetyltransferase